MVKVIRHKAASPPHMDDWTVQSYSRGGANVHPIYRKAKHGCRGSVPYVQGIGNMCILSADHSNPLHNQLPSRYRSHKTSYSISLVPKLVAMAASLSTSGLPSNTRFLGPIQAHNPNGISIGSAVFAQMTVEYPYTSPQKLPLPMGDLMDPHLTHGSMGPPKSLV